ncbi:hypothetical protein ABT336_13205 [Micromonospora sp. NPDC000207]|uniref:hypothetical protein n=1 Tax=Micromonospora sp. NPDC000207 TaxID=3154246 RepID=UPI00331A67B0
MTDILSRINAAVNNLCPCGADPRPGSVYCSADCEPTHISRDTDTSESGWYATPMRWRPDLVTAADDTNLIPVEAPYAAETVAIREGRHNASIYHRASEPTVWHLRLNDGHRYVGCDLTDMGTPDGTISVEQTARIHDTWQRLEQELGNSRHLEPDTRGASATRTWHDEVVMVNDRDAEILRHAGLREGTHFLTYEQSVAQAIALEQMQQRVNETMDAMWQALRSSVQHAADQVATVWLSIQEAARHLEPMLGEQPPADPMERALWLRKRRNTGPTQDRLDGRRRRSR